jgi:4-alpha-glucanotransferase
VSEEDLRALAASLGVALEWEDYRGRPHTVSAPALRRVLAALGFACDTAGELAASRDAARDVAVAASRAPLVTGVVGNDVVLPSAKRRGGFARLRLDDGSVRDVPLRNDDGRVVVPGIAVAGYHRLVTDDGETTLAVAPPRCITVDDIAPGERLWGLSAQIYGVRRVGDGGAGDGGAVAALGIAAAQNGADALGLSPAHALFTADRTRYGPYAPSSRLFLNPLYADARAIFGNERVAAAIRDTGIEELWRAQDDNALVDWPTTARLKETVHRHLFDSFLANEVPANTSLAADFAEFRREGGALLEEHATFEAIHAARFAADPHQWSWRAWPEAWRDAAGKTVRRFAEENAREVTYHVFLQWLADRSFAAAQAAMRGAGARIGMIADLAVGMDVSGSHAWGRPHDILVGLSVGAPPDEFNQRGQNWGITAFSPQALVAHGFAPFLATLRAAMRHAGGVRIDHVMGLARLWVVPEGAGPNEGAYLRYPLDDLLRLTAIESHRQRAIVVGEDLGTVPHGFRERLEAAGIYGMRVLWFERDASGFWPPQAWTPDAVAVTTTHDLPTVAGWWRGNDIALRARHGALAGDDAAATEMHAREGDRSALWHAFREAGAAAGDPPPPDEPERAIEGAAAFVAQTPSRLAVLPVEDALGLAEQPNLPGTVDEHPNWRRRYPVSADRMLDATDVQVRINPFKTRARR